MKEKLIRPIFRFFNSKSKNAEIYINNGSVWLIFTNEKRWVFELTKEGTLWYNYYFFENILKYFSLEVVKNQDYITKWVENFIQNGVKHTVAQKLIGVVDVENFIQNGVKHTDGCQIGTSTSIEDAIQNGVKETKHNLWDGGLAMEEAIQNGVKHTEYGDWLDGDERFDDIIENGVKETKQEEHHRLREIVQTVKNGIKETKTPSDGDIRSTMEWMKEKETNSVPKMIDDIIENGVKETIPHFLEILNPINFEPVIKEMKRMNEVNIVLEEGIKETKYCELHSLMRADHIIRDGIKETHWKRVDNHPTFVDSIIQTKNPS